MNIDIPMMRRIIEKTKEIKRLYELTDAESICMIQMAAALKELDFPPELHMKCLKALVAIQEMSWEEFKLMEKK